MEQKTINHNKLQTLLCIVALTLGVLVSAVLFCMLPVHAAEAKEYEYTVYYTNRDYKFELYISADNPVYMLPYNKPRKFGFSWQQYYQFIALKKDGSAYEVLPNIISKRYKWNSSQNDYVLDTSYSYTPGSTGYQSVNELTTNGSSSAGYIDLNNSGIKVIYTNVSDDKSAIMEYLLRGGVSDSLLGDNGVFFTLSSTKILPLSTYYIGWNGDSSGGNCDLRVTNYNISDKGVLSWQCSPIPDNVVTSGMTLMINYGNGAWMVYRNVMPLNAQVQLNLKELTDEWGIINSIRFLPFYVSENHRIYTGQNITTVGIDKTKPYYSSDDTVPIKYLNDWNNSSSVVKPGGDGDFGGGVTDPSGYLYPDESSTTIQGNNSIKLIDFNVDKNFKASWSGLDGIGLQTSKYSFIEFEVAFASNTSPGNVLTKKVVKERCSISKGSFQIPSEYTTLDSNSYVLYVKATPYHYNGDNPSHRLYKGSVSYKYFNNDGTPSWDYSDSTDLPSGGGGIRRGTVNLTDFLLSGVSVKDSLLGYSTITWTGTTKDNDLLFIPESDTLVIASYILTTKNGDDYKYTPVTYTTTTINAGKINVNVAKLVDEAQKSGEAWDMQIRLTPAYTDNGILYMGEQTVCHMTDKSVKNETTTPDGSIKIDDVTNNVVPGDVDGKVEITADDLAGYTNTFVSFLKGLISAMGQIPQLLGTVFSFLPDMYRNAIGILFVVILILRILGR